MTPVNLTMFNDVENNRIRNRNRAVTLANLFEDHMEAGSRCTSKIGGSLILAYFGKVPEEDRKAVYEDYKLVMSERGFEISKGA